MKFKLKFNEYIKRISTLLFAVLLLQFISGCCSIPTATPHFARPVPHREISFDASLSTSYNAGNGLQTPSEDEGDFVESLLGFEDFEEFLESAAILATIGAGFGMPHKFGLDLRVFAPSGVGFEIAAKKCFVENTDCWFSTELGYGLCGGGEGEEKSGYSLEAYDYEEERYYTNNYFYLGSLFQFKYYENSYLNIRIAGYYAIVGKEYTYTDNIEPELSMSEKTSFKSLFPLTELSIINGDKHGLALNTALLWVENPSNHKRYLRVNFGMSFWKDFWKN